jgi:prepilin-type N-terminal cleavage/methylation domain-containing protein
MSREKRSSCRKRKAPKGLTLIELLIVVAISAVIMIALLSLYMEGQKYFFNEDAKADAIEDSRFPMTWISRDLREALQVVASHGSYSTDENTVVLEVPSIDPGTGALMTGSQDYIIYRRNPNYPEKLERIIVAAPGTGRQDRTRVMADAVNAFGLTYYKQDGITPATTITDTFIVDITLSSSMKGIQRTNQPYVEALNTRVRLRNKAVS